MKWIKYVGAVLSVLLIIGTLPSIILISNGLIVGKVDDPAYFTGKLLAYLLIIAILAIISVKLFKSARK